MSLKTKVIILIYTVNCIRINNFENIWGTIEKVNHKVDIQTSNIFIKFQILQRNLISYRISLLDSVWIWETTRQSDQYYCDAATAYKKFKCFFIEWVEFYKHPHSSRITYKSMTHSPSVLTRTAQHLSSNWPIGIHVNVKIIQPNNFTCNIFPFQI